MSSSAHSLRLPIYLVVPCYLVLGAAIAGLLWLGIVGSSPLPRWAAMAIWIVIASPFVLAANQWAGTVTVDAQGIAIRTVLRKPVHIKWDDLGSVRLVVTSHARDDRSVVVRSKGRFGKKICYSTARKGFVPCTRTVVEEAERRDVPVKASTFDPRHEWDAYLGVEAAEQPEDAKTADDSLPLA